MALKKQFNSFGYLIFFSISALLIYRSALTTPQAHTLFITMITATLWVTEKLPIPVSSLIPLATFPLLGILNSKSVAQSYGSPLILLLLGGFMLSVAMSHTQTHRLIANKIITIIGIESQKRVLLSFMLTAGLLSMWISNTATTLMLLPIALAIIEHNNSRNFAIILLLGIAYSASIGGTATPIGTPPNLIMIQALSDIQTIGFLSWMQQVLPILLIVVPLAYFYLASYLNNQPINYQLSDIEITATQKKVLGLFLITALLWMTRVERFGGWKALFNLPYANDASVAMLAVVALFTLKGDDQKPIMTWQAVNKIPWGILLLFAGGITIATAFKETGLSESIASQLVFLDQLPLWLVVGMICLFVTFLTEVTSNTATTAVLMPILLSTAQAINVDPMALMLPATVSASFAFMMPVATAPNAIIFSSGRIPIKKMMKVGFWLNIMGAMVLTSYFYLLQ